MGVDGRGRGREERKYRVEVGEDVNGRKSACTRARRSKEEKVESSVKKDKQVKITTRDVGIQAQCTYKWKWETPRFHVLPDESTGAFV